MQEEHVIAFALVEGSPDGPHSATAVTINQRAFAVDRAFRANDEFDECVAAALESQVDAALRDGVPCAAVFWGSSRVLPVRRVMEAALTAVVASGVRAEASFTGLDGQKMLHDMAPSDGARPCSIVLVPGLGLFVAGAAYDAASATRVPGDVDDARWSAVTLDCIFHRGDAGPARVLVSYVSDASTVERVVNRRATGGEEVLGSVFGGSTRTTATAAVSHSDTTGAKAALQHLGVASAVFNVTRKRSANPSFSALLEAAQRDARCDSPTATQLAKVQFLEARAAAATGSTATSQQTSPTLQPSRRAAQNNARDDAVALHTEFSPPPRVATEADIRAASHSQARSSSADSASHAGRACALEERVAALEAELDDTRRRLAASDARAARAEAMHIELETDTRQAARRSADVELRLRREIATLTARNAELERAAPRSALPPAAAGRPESPKRVPPRAPTPTAPPAQRSTARSEPQRTTPPAAAGRRTSPRHTSPTTSSQPSSRPASTGRPAARPNPSSQPMSRTSSRTSTPVAASARPSSPTNLRAQSPRAARELLQRTSFHAPTASSVARDKSELGRPRLTPATLSQLPRSRPAEEPAAAAIVTVRPKLVTPVRAGDTYRSDKYVTTYRPTRMVRHQEWESAQDALKRDRERKARGGASSSAATSTVGA